MTTQSSEPFPVVFIGAGNVMFGSDEGPWNQALRWEQKLGSRLNMLAVVDPDVARVKRTLETKRGDPALRSAYANTESFPNIDELIKAYAGKEQTVKAFVIGTPPAFRGGVTPGKNDIELKVVKAFPHAHLLIEKPVAAGEIDDAFAVGRAIDAAKVGSGERIVSVAYMLRYLKASTYIKRIIEAKNLTVMATHARYATAYTAIAKPFWWDKAASGGPIVEQGTHFCDLSRYFGGNVVPNSVQARATEWNEPAGKLSKIPSPVDESKVPEERRIPRATSASWKYESGAVGSLVHIVGMQGTAYSCEIEVFADGYLFKLEDPYGRPLLRVRTPESDEEEIHTFEGDDPFFNEVSAFVDVIDGGAPSSILSSFLDACGTYQLSWDIRNASEIKV